MTKTLEELETDLEGARTHNPGAVADIEDSIKNFDENEKKAKKRAAKNKANQKKAAKPAKKKK